MNDSCDKNVMVGCAILALGTILTAGVSTYAFYNYNLLWGLYVGIGIGARVSGAIAGIGLGAYYCSSSFWKSEDCDTLLEPKSSYEGINLNG